MKLSDWSHLVHTDQMLQNCMHRSQF